MTEQNVKKIRVELGNKLRNAREKLNLTQAEVADHAGITKNYYSRIERGTENPSFETLQAIMRVVKIKSIGLL